MHSPCVNTTANNTTATTSATATPARSSSIVVSSPSNSLKRASSLDLEIVPVK